MDNVNTEQILRYLEGEMTPEEKNRFEESLSQNKALADESRRLSLSIDAIKYLGVVEKVKKAHTDLKAEGSIKGLQSGRVIPIKRILRYSIAAAACVLFVLVGIKAWEFYSLDPDRLYSKAYVDYDLSATRGNTEERSEIETAYLQKDYSKVVSIAGKRQDLDLSESLFTGLSQMNKKDFAAAIPHLRKTAAVENKRKADAEFYLAMAYLKNRDFDLSINLMEKIRADANHPYHERFTDNYIKKIRMLKWQ